MKTIAPENLLSMNDHEGRYPLRIDLAYAQADNFLFGEQIYRKDAQLWLHTDLAAVVLEASLRCHERTGCRLVLYDGLRTVEAQEKMLHTERVQQNLHWLEEPRLLSPPGVGGHPRGMAVDLSMEDDKGHLLDMGTPFDFLAQNPNPLHNPAHRQHVRLSRDVTRNRTLLTDFMMAAAEHLNIPLLPLPQEWWDYRLPASVYEQYAPISDKDLPPEMRMVAE